MRHSKKIKYYQHTKVNDSYQEGCRLVVAQETLQLWMWVKHWPASIIFFFFFNHFSSFLFPLVWIWSLFFVFFSLFMFLFFMISLVLSYYQLVNQWWSTLNYINQYENGYISEVWWTGWTNTLVVLASLLEIDCCLCNHKPLPVCFQGMRFYSGMGSSYRGRPWRKFTISSWSLKRSLKWS